MIQKKLLYVVFNVLITTLKINTAIANLVRTKLKKHENKIANNAKVKSFRFFLTLNPTVQPEPTECPSESSDLALCGELY